MDGRRRPSDGQSLWVDNVKQDHPVNHWPIFSRDGAHTAYAADSGGATARQRFVVLDGVPGQRYEAPLMSMQYSRRDSDFVGQPVFGGPDGKRLAYRATRGKLAFVVADGQEGKEYEQIGGIAFSPDGQRLVYVAVRDKQWVMIGSGAPEGKEAQYEALGSPAFGANGRLGFQAKREGKQFIVVDGVEGTKYGWASAPRFSPDGKHVAYFASHGGVAVTQRGARFGGSQIPYYLTCGDKCVAVIDGIEQVLPGPPGAFLSVNNDGVVAYSYGKNLTVAKNGRPVLDKQTTWVAVVGGKEIAQTQSKNFYDPIGPIIFSPDGKRHAFRLTRSPDEKSFMVVDGSEQKGYADVSDPVFSPDGRHLAYFAKDMKRSALVVDGTELFAEESDLQLFGPSAEMSEAGLWPGGPLLWRRSSPVRFVDSSTMQSFAIRGRDIARLTMNIVEAGAGDH